MKLSRVWAMPNKATFSIKPISELLDRWIPVGSSTVIVDPFCGDSKRGTIRNDLRDPGGQDAESFCCGLEVNADAVLFDPPYSPRQISECYKSIGLHAAKKDTQNAGLYSRVKVQLDRILRPGGIAICCGWNSTGFGRNYVIEEILLVNHGAAHNDTIVTVWRK